MYKKFSGLLAAILLIAFLAPVSLGCGPWKSMKQWAGYSSEEEPEETVPPESQQETVTIDGKAYVRSKNPYWLSYPDAPEYLYVPKGTEFTSAQQYMMNSLAEAITKKTAQAQSQGVPPDKLQQMVKAEVDRILREQGLSAFVSQGRGAASPFVGRSVAVIPDLDTPTSYEGLNRSLAISLGDALARTKDIRVVGQDQVRTALSKAGIVGKINLAPNIRALGDALGVQGIVLTGIMPPEKGGGGAMALQVYDTFGGNKEQSFAGTPEAGSVNAAAVTKFVNANALGVGGALLNIPWFGRVDFVQDGKVYLNLGQNAGLKVGDRLRVVTAGKAVVNPATQAVLGYTADQTQGELKVTELLSNTGAVATTMNGGPFKPNDRVRGK